MIMSDAAPSNLIHLIRLLDGNLSAGEEDSARRRLADNAELADRFRYLTQIVRRSMTADELLRHVDEVDPSEIAEFLEQRMTASEQAAFEQRCWSSEGLLREVVSNCRADTEASAASRDVPPAAHVQTVVAAVLAHAGSAAEPLPSAADPEPPALSEAPVFPTGLPQIEVSRSTSQVHRSPRRSSGLMMVTAGLVFAVLVFGLQFAWRNDPDRQARQDETDRTVPPEQDDSPTPLVRDDSEPKPDPLPDDPEALEKPDSTPIVNNDPQDKLPTIPQTPQPQPFVPPVRTLVEWSEIRGIAGVRNTDTNVWSGILARDVADLWKSNASTQLLTLSDSTVSGEAVNGARLIADADSLMTISAVWKSGSRTSQADGELIPVCEVQSGRAAFDGLLEGQSVIVRVNGQSYDVVATRDDTTIAFEAEATGTVLAAYRGELTVDGESLSRRQWATVSRAGELTSFRPQQVNNWPRTKPGPSTLPPDLCANFNQSASLVREAASLRQVQDPMTAYAATQVTLQCSVSGTRPLPAQLTRQIANSRIEARRETMVRWLIARTRQAGTTDEVRRVCRAAQVADPAAILNISGWFDAAAKNQAPTRAQLSQLLQTLNGNSIFAKQCAKYFLHQITGDPMDDYDPAATARQQQNAVKRITGKIRQLQQRK